MPFFLTSQPPSTAAPRDWPLPSRGAVGGAERAGFPGAGPERFQAYTRRHLGEIPQLQRLGRDSRFAMEVVSAVLPFRVNRYVVENLIDWDRVPEDPIFQMTFPQPGMLAGEDFRRVADLLLRGAPADALDRAVSEIRARLNPHPSGQLDLNVPAWEGRPLPGMQHKYRETVLFFPNPGQTCHAYCSFCFRWPQFVGDKGLKMASAETEGLFRYLAAHPGVSDLLVTGGDPMIMKTPILERYLAPLLDDPGLAHVRNLRIGTKSLTYWPQRFVSDEDADGVLRLIERFVKAGRHVAIMAHLNHGRELDTPIAREAIRRLRAAGAAIRSQGPVLAHVNDDAGTWARMWREQVRLGIVPYYMFVERDTGARRYFEIPLVRAWEVYSQAIQRVSGLARTARGPSMSAGPGKVEVLGPAEIRGEKVLSLRFLQGRDPAWTGRPFFARLDPRATWLDQLRPAFGESAFFFEEAFEAMRGASSPGRFSPPQGAG